MGPAWLTLSCATPGPSKDSWPLQDYIVLTGWRHCTPSGQPQWSPSVLRDLTLGNRFSSQNTPSWSVWLVRSVSVDENWHPWGSCTDRVQLCACTAFSRAQPPAAPAFNPNHRQAPYQENKECVHILRTNNHKCSLSVMPIY